MLLSTTGAMEALLHMKPVFTGNLRVQFFYVFWFALFHTKVLKCGCPA